MPAHPGRPEPRRPQPRKTEPRKTEPDAARRLLDSARDAFAAKGFHGTSTREIATGAHMSPAAMYIHYASKEDVLFQLSLAGHTDVLTAMTAAADDDAGEGKDATARLRSAVYAFAHWHAENHMTARIIQSELRSLSAEHGREIVAVRRSTEETLRAVIAAGVNSGDFRVDDIDVVTLAIMSMCIDIVRWFPVRTLPDADSVGTAYAGLAARMVGATG